MAKKASTQGQPAYQNKPSSDYIDVEHKEAMRHPTLLKVKDHGFLSSSGGKNGALYLKMSSLEV